MAASVGSREVTPVKLFDNTSNNEGYLCKNCLDHEAQLKEALDELSTAKVIISILQEEILSNITSAPTSGVNLSITKEPHQELNATEWTTIAHRNKSGTLQKQSKQVRGEKVSSSSTVQSENRYSLLYNLEKKECDLSQNTTKPPGHQTKGNIIPTIVNGNSDYYKNFPSLTHERERLQVQNMISRTVISPGKDKHKILIVGDSHAKNCASLLQDDLGANFTVTSFVKSGANMKEIINTTEDLLTSQSDDLVVIWGGANDIRMNNMREAVKSVSKFVETNKNLNVILINTPHRYDLSQESCVNTEVAKFNRQVKEIMKHQPQVEILELALDRRHFTTHGLHLNFKGKTVVSQSLASAVLQCFNKETNLLTAIPIPWKDHPLINNNITMEVQDISISTIPNILNTAEEVDHLTSPIQEDPLSNSNTTMELHDANTSSISNTKEEVGNSTTSNQDLHRIDNHITIDLQDSNSSFIAREPCVIGADGSYHITHVVVHSGISSNDVEDSAEFSRSEPLKPQSTPEVCAAGTTEVISNEVHLCNDGAENAAIVSQNEVQKPQEPLTTQRAHSGGIQDRTSENLPFKRIRKPPTNRHDDFLWFTTS